jgi:plastocyanin
MKIRWWLVGLCGVGFLMSGAVGSSFGLLRLQYQGGPVAEKGSVPETFLVVEALRLQYQGGPVFEKGSVSGVVKAAGQPPVPKPIEVNKDQDECGKSQPAESLILDAGNEVKNALIRLTNIVKGKRLDTATKVVLDQAKCRFVPHVVIVPVGATLEIKNSDPITHNFRTFSIENDPINRAQPKNGPVISTKFTLPEMFKAQCDIHKWMSAWIVVADNPYSAVTDDKGQFMLADVPPAPGAGFYQMEIWHEMLGKVTKEVTVKANADTRMSVELKK